MQYHIVSFNKPQNFIWKFGEVFEISKSNSDIKNTIEKLAKLNGLTLFWDFKFGEFDFTIFECIQNSKGDIWHGTYSNELLYYPKLFHKTYPCWLLNLVPEKKNDFTSWKYYFHCSIFKNEVFKICNISEKFKNIDYACLDFSLRLLKSGVIPIYKKCLNDKLKQPDLFNQIEYNLNDEIEFAKSHATKSLRIFGLFLMLSNYKLFSNLKLNYFTSNPYQPLNSIKIIRNQSISLPTNCEVSVVIITLGRYDYIKNVLVQLLDQTIKPCEIIIVDSTPKPQIELIEDLQSLDTCIKYHSFPIIGQCSQRNYGIKIAIGSYILFMDDDMDDIPLNHIEKHVSNLQIHNADCSNGTPDEIGVKQIDRNLAPVVSDVFPTNDTLIAKEYLIKAGGFDELMDKGQSEDHDLGIRVFLAGALMIKSYSLNSVHLRASTGGLRTHGNRKQTYSSSRSKLNHFRLPHKTEIYMKLKYFRKAEIYYFLLISLFGTFSYHGSSKLKITKAIVALFYLPVNIRRIFLNYWSASKLNNNRISNKLNTAKYLI
jgi:glycosyltransferase involved in cell wall biosynthesis